VLDVQQLCRQPGWRRWKKKQKESAMANKGFLMSGYQLLTWTKPGTFTNEFLASSR
jgi:hypothetical protein